METIYFGGEILTMEGPEDRAEAVLVRDGMIITVGSLSEACRASKKAKLRDLKGKCLMPGFIDAHGHVVMNGQMAQMADLSDCKTFADVEYAMKQFITVNNITEKQIALGRGYDHNFLREQAHPGKTVLDRISDRVPILILHVSGHLACGNSPMLALAGITAETPDPKGGKIGRMPGTMEPDGVLEEGATVAVQELVGKRMKGNLLKILSSMQRNYVAHGITTVQEGAGTAENFRLLQLARRLGLLNVDVVFYALMNREGKRLLRDNPAWVGRYRGGIKLGGYKMILDGSPQGRTAWLSQPYEGEDGYCGYPWLAEEEAEENIRTAIGENCQLLTHCNGDAASEQLLNAYEKMLQTSKNPNKHKLRPVMIHCQTVRRDQLERMAKISMIPSIFVGHVWYWGDIHLKNLGRERGSCISPVRDAVETGLVVNFHQDTPITEPDVLHSVWAAVNRISRGGQVIGQEQKIGVYDALKAVTINAAYSYFEEDTKGSIRVGKRADLVILEKCPLDVDPMGIKDIRVMETIKDGRTIYRA